MKCKGSAVIGLQGVSAYLLVYFYEVHSLRKQPIIRSYCQQRFIGAQRSTSHSLELNYVLDKDFFEKYVPVSNVLLGWVRQ